MEIPISTFVDSAAGSRIAVPIPVQTGRGAEPRRGFAFPGEPRWLACESAILQPITERLLRSAGIGPGMRVLDLRCGGGDVAMLTALLVGPTGAVVSIDPEQQMIALARQRVRAANLGQVEFRMSDLEGFTDCGLFDAVIGRCVLARQLDPAVFLRTAARFLRPRGIVAFHEMGFHRCFHSQPRVWLAEVVASVIVSALRSALPHYLAGGRLVEHFSQAGLACPTLFSETPIGGGEESPLYEWMAETVRNMLPYLVARGMAIDEVMAIDTLESRLRAAVVEARSQIELPAQICARTRT